ncbi:MAG: NYN domain-containing protein [Lachnospiraceae bacterium]|nr:NYN domain-containing protein [Lachnospiraceae bacterium]
MQEVNKDINIALLVDVDNIAWRYTESILSELSKYGKVTIRRLYGDWSQPRLKGWLSIAQKYSLTPIMQPNNTPGKNASDIGLIIDAMDILYSEQVQGFCIASSDGDFNKLATRIREAGKLVIGMGEKKTPESFRASCERFVFLDIIQSDEEDETISSSARSSRTRRRAGVRKTSRAKSSAADTAVAEEAQIADTDLSDIYGHADDEFEDVLPEDDSESSAILDTAVVEDAIVKMIADNEAEGKPTGLGEIGSRLVKIYPDFDIRNYGYSKLSSFLKDLASLSVSQKDSDVWVSLKSTSLKDIEARIREIFSENKTKVMNMGLLKSELEKRLPNLNATIRKNGVTRFSVFLDRKIPCVRLENDGNLAVLK